MKRTLDDGSWYRPREAARLEEEAAKLSQGFEREVTAVRWIRQGTALTLAVGGSTLFAMFFFAEAIAWEWGAWFVPVAVALGVASYYAELYVEGRRSMVSEEVDSLRLAALDLREEHRQLRSSIRSH